MSRARARILGLYSAFGLFGGFIGASGFSILYGWNFRYPLFAIGIGYGLCVIIGGSMVRLSESRSRVLSARKEETSIAEMPLADPV